MQGLGRRLGGGRGRNGLGEVPGVMGDGGDGGDGVAAGDGVDVVVAVALVVAAGGADGHELGQQLGRVRARQLGLAAPERKIIT